MATRAAARSASGRPGRTRPGAALPAALALVAAYNVVGNLLLPSAAYVPANLAFAGALVALARRSGATAGDLGLRTDRLGRGLRAGLAVLALVTAVVVAAAFVPAAGNLFEDTRVAGVGAAGMAYQTLVRIPLGTAVTEEVVFRGVLLGMLLRRTSPRAAVAGSSVAFGLWHVLPALETAGATPALPSAGTPAGMAAAAGAAVAATTVGGLLFAWLRLRAESLLAPTLAHAATNGVAFAVAWALAGG